MKLLDFFKKSPPASGSELEKAVCALKTIEGKRDAAKEALERAQADLREAYATSISGEGEEPDTGAVIDAQARLDAVNALHQEAWTSALSILARARDRQKEQIDSIDAEIGEVQKAISRRRMEALARFAKQHGLVIEWPTHHGAGKIILPAVPLDPDEVSKIAEAVSDAPKPDQDAGKLERLVAERLRANMIIKSLPDVALATLVAEAQRR